MKTWRVAFIMLLVIAVTVLGLLSGEVVSAQNPSVFIYARPLSRTIDPVVSAGDEEIQNIYMVYDTLVTLDEDLNVVPSLAERWEISNDYKVFTFYLRRGVKFHDGTPLTAAAVKFSFDRLLKTGMQAIGSYSDLATADSVTVLDDYTVRITLTESYPGFLTDELIHGVYAIVNPEYVKAHTTSSDPHALEWLTRNANGTGPFILKEWIPGERMVFDRNDDYWNEDRMPQMARVIFRIFSESSTARLWLERGEVHAAEKLTPDDFEALEKHAAVDVRVIDYPLSIYLMMDVSQPPFDDVFVRKAIAYAINYDEIIDEVERGQVERANGIMPSGMMGHNEHPLPYRYEPEVARELLRQSSFPNGFTIDLRFTSERRGSFSLMAIYLQAYLAEIDINVQPWNMSLGALNESQRGGAYGISLRQWSAGLPSPDEVGGWLYDMERGDGCWGWVGTFWYDEWAMNNMRKARTEFDPERREELYRITDAYASELAIYIPLFQSKKLIAVRNEVKAFDYTPYLFGRFYSAEL